MITMFRFLFASSFYALISVSHHLTPFLSARLPLFIYFTNLFSSLPPSPAPSPALYLPPTTFFAALSSCCKRARNPTNLPLKSPINSIFRAKISSNRSVYISRS